MAKRQITSETGGKYWVAGEADLTAAEKSSGWWPAAPEPWYSRLAQRWFKGPLTSDPWLVFPMSDDGAQDTLWDQYRQVAGELPQRVPWVKAGGRREDYVHAASNYWQDFKLFQGIVDAPESIAAKLAAMQGEFTKWMGGPAGCYLTLSGNPSYGPGPVVNLFFEKAELPPQASQERGFFHWIHEGAEFDLNANIIIPTYQKVLIQGGIEVPSRHPALRM